MANFEFLFGIFVMSCSISKANPSTRASSTTNLPSVNVKNVFDRYVDSQGEQTCPFTITFASSYGKFIEDFTFPSIISKAYFSILLAPIATNVSSVASEGALVPQRRHTNHCNTIAALVAKSWLHPRQLTDHLKSTGTPARDRYLILLSENLLQQMSSEFKAFRFVIAAAFDSSIIYFKSLQSPCHLLQTVYATTSLPKMSTKPINLNGVQLRIAYILVSPFLLKDSNGKLTKGLSHSIYSTAARHFNFTFEYVPLPDPRSGTGRKLPNGSWTGLLGALDSGRADIALSTAVTLDRMQGPFEFTEFYYLVYGSFVTAHPRLAVVRWETLVQPFRTQTWLLILATFASFSITMFAVLWVGLFSDAIADNQGRSQSHKLVFMSVLLPLRLLLEQGGGRLIPSRVRILVGLWMFLCLVLCTGYKEKLFGFITFPKEETIPQSIEQLAERTDYTILYNYWPSAMYFAWEKSPQSDFKSVFDSFEKTKGPFNCVVRAALEPKTACIAYTFELLAAMSANLTYDKHFSPVYMTAERYFPALNSLPLPKGSVFVDSWKWIASWLRDFDLPMKWSWEVYEDYRTTGIEWLKTDRGDARVWDRIESMKKSLIKVPKALRMSDFLILFVVSSGLALVSAGVFLVGEREHGISKPLLGSTCTNM